MSDDYIIVTDDHAAAARLLDLPLYRMSPEMTRTLKTFGHGLVWNAETEAIVQEAEAKLAALLAVGKMKAKAGIDP